MISVSLAIGLKMSSQFKHSPRAFDGDVFNRSENTDEYSICMTRYRRELNLSSLALVGANLSAELSKLIGGVNRGDLILIMFLILFR